MQSKNTVSPSNSKTSPLFFASAPQHEHTERSNSVNQSSGDTQRAQSISGHDQSWDEAPVCIHDSRPPYEATGARAYQCFANCVRKHVLAIHSERLSLEEQGLAKIKMELDEMLKREKKGYDQVQERLNEAFLLLRKARGKIARINAVDYGAATDYDGGAASRSDTRE